MGACLSEIKESVKSLLPSTEDCETVWQINQYPGFCIPMTTHAKIVLSSLLHYMDCKVTFCRQHCLQDCWQNGCKDKILQQGKLGFSNSACFIGLSMQQFTACGNRN